ncbi:MAG: peptidylprolyl isomerase [Planctomycetes bacterium]|nr:peptidylprolyl isomerase [Planctomycetota bacterium]
MHRPRSRAIALSLLALTLPAALRCQQAAGRPDATAQQPQPPAVVAQQQDEPHFLVRHYPRDRDAAIAQVGDRTLTLGDLVDHIDVVHYPGFREALGKRPEIERMLQSDLVAPWVRQFADLEALRQTFGDELDATKLKEAQSTALQRSFQSWLDAYIADRKANDRPIDLTQQQVNRLLADFQLRQGIAAELQGALDHLEPGDYTRAQLQQFFNDNARAFGGRVTMAHILIQHRDGGRGILLADEGFARATARLADVEARLRPDGSNFEEVARGFSDDTRTAPNGGVLHGVHRFDDRLPAVLCRTAWFLRDGEVSGVVESQYGWHIVKRIEFSQQMFILFTEDAIPSIRQVMIRSRQEDRLFQAREKSKLRLLL